ncbi:uncharacterized protein LOC131935847 [Physella acuta]|uniref:uncharacterized protein LOC131935847 n=1 Tax=Physella acuta TaxID=109671 RepID=UPI0027DC09E5|nr:uncharacterized protein LOC131935847 [Physella acuta]
MASFDLSELCMDWARSNEVTGQVNLDNVKLQVENIQWRIKPEDFTSNTGSKRKLCINYSQHHNEMYSDIETSKDSNVSTSIYLNKGVVTGINKRLRLPLQNGPLQLKELMGDFMDIDPGKPMSSKEDNMTLTVASAHKMAWGTQRSTQADVSTHEEHFTATFTCRVVCKGKALFSHGDEIDIAQIVSDQLLTSGLGRVLTVKRNDGWIRSGPPVSFSWELEGECEIHGAFEQIIQWT